MLMLEAWHRDIFQTTFHVISKVLPVVATRTHSHKD